MTDELCIHPAFPQPNDPSVSIWRYMDASKFEWLISCGRLFMPSAAKLGEPLEGSTPSGELEWWQRQAVNAKNNEARSIIEHNRKFLSQMAMALRDHYYVSCWHMNSHENRAMWDCYTTGAESVAIRTSYAALRGALPRYVEMGIVRYLDYATARLPSMNMFEYIMHKDTYYAYEQEVRAVAMPPPADEFGLADFKSNHFESKTIKGFLIYAPPVDVKTLLHGIVLHPDSPNAYVATVCELCSKNGLPEPERSRRTRKPIF